MLWGGINATAFFQRPGVSIIHGLIDENWAAVSKCSGEGFTSCTFAHGATALSRAPCVMFSIT